MILLNDSAEFLWGEIRCWSLLGFKGLISSPLTPNPLPPCKVFKPLTPISDQDRISPYNVDTISTRQVMTVNISTRQENYQFGDN